MSRLQSLNLTSQEKDVLRGIMSSRFISELGQI